MANLLEQAAIGDDPAFQRRVRAAIVTRALAAATSAVVTLPVKRLAQAVLEKPDEWSVQIARGLASKTDGTPVVSAGEITDAQIVTFLDAVFIAYIVAS